MGGTFMSLDSEYRDYFIRNLHDALSGHTSNKCDGPRCGAHDFPPLTAVTSRLYTFGGYA